MNNRLKKSIVSVILCLVFVLCQIPCTVLAETVDYNTVLKESVILKANCARYIKNGNVVSYENNSGYYPQYKGGELKLTFEIIKNVLGCSGSYDKKRETAVLKKGDKTVSIRVGEDGIYCNDTVKYITNTAEKTSKGILIPFNSAAQGLGYNITQDNDIIIASPYKKTDITSHMISEFDNMLAGDERILTSDFEDVGAWGYQTWNDGSAETAESINTEFYQGQKSMYIGTTQKGFIGMMTSRSFDYKKSDTYRIKLALKTTSDYKNNKLNILMWGYNSSGNYIGGIPFEKVTEDDFSAEWKNFTFDLNEYEIRSRQYQENGGLSRFYILISQDKQGDEPASGGVYIDNVVLEKYSAAAEGVDCDFVADKFAAWYQLGDTVTYTTQNSDALTGYDSVRSVFYNGDKEVVYSQSNPVNSVIKDGIKYTPAEPGIYYLDLYAVARDGTERPIAVSYEGSFGGKMVNFEQKERSFAVVEGSPRAMEDRNDLWMHCVSVAGQMEMQYQLGELLGFSGVRADGVNWGSGWGTEGQGIEDEQGTYNWETSDRAIGMAKKYNMKNVLINIIQTPKWAVPEIYQDDTPIDIGYLYNKVAPTKENMPALGKYVKELYKRYGDTVNIMEFWNEPHYGKTYFWADTPENLSEMQKVAYKALREVDQEKKVTMAACSWNQGYQLFKELMKDKEYYESFDMFTFHSRNAEDLKKYEGGYTDNGYEKKPVGATEEYLYAYYSRGEAKDHDINSMHYISTSLNHLKQDLRTMALFEITDNVPDEVRAYCEKNGIGTSHVMGLFQVFPYVEPHKGAVVAYNFMNSFNSEYSFEGEYDFGEGQKAAYIYTDNEPLVVVWNSDDKAFYLDEKLKATFDEDTEFIDFEGKTISPDEQLKPKKVYFIKKNNKEQMDAMEKKEGACVNSDFVAPYYNCKMPEFTTVEAPKIESLPDVPRTKNLSEKPFDEKTFVMNDNIEWTTDNWEWKTDAHERPAGYDAKFVTHVDNDGLYLVVDVDDSAVYTPTDEETMFASDMYQSDSIQFAVDCLGTGDPEQRAEFQAGLLKGKPTLFKHVAPNVAFNMLTGWSSGGSTLSEDYVRIEKTQSGLRYKVFVPMTELFPFQYSKTTEYLRFSLLVNNSDGGEKGVYKRSYMEWSSGIGSSKDPKLFGAIIMK